jgi:cytochrome c peroxidase
MWDGRETSLSQQAIDATLIHAQAANPPSAAQIAAIVAFETAHFTAQSVDNTAQALNDAGATGGPVALAASATALFPSFQAWANLPGNDAESVARRSIARGEQLFNTRPFQITNVAGLTQPGQAISGNCRSCHNANGANGQAFVDIGVTGPQPPALDVSGLPVFTLVCKTDGTIATVTDPGRAMVTGQCADIGKTKIPTLRALAARAPYFHNGSAARLTDVVGFYDRRFRIGLSPQERADLVAYLSAL